jgi:hypothetical protein
MRTSNFSSLSSSHFLASWKMISTRLSARGHLECWDNALAAESTTPFVDIDHEDAFKALELDRLLDG